jgi:uncharacterized protein
MLGTWAIFSIILFLKISGKSVKAFLVTNLLLGIGFGVYLYVHSQWIPLIESKEWSIFLSRLSLLIILIPVAVGSLFNKTPFIKYWRKPDMNEMIVFPFIWSGFHRTTVKRFLLIALSVNLLVFLPLLVANGWSFAQKVWLIAILFSVTNAVLEELIWRGSLLSRFSDQLGDQWAVVLTSVGFGLQHYSLGFPWGVCLAFSIGGMFFGGITIRSNSIFPSIGWHIVLNMLMVLSGVILK